MEKPISINDLKDLDYRSDDLSPQQRLAIKNFDRFRFKTLSGIKSENKFHQEFQKLQSMANLSSYEDFLKDPYL